jgi:hypothetical protein
VVALTGPLSNSRELNRLLDQVARRVSKIRESDLSPPSPRQRQHRLTPDELAGVARGYRLVRHEGSCQTVQGPPSHHRKRPAEAWPPLRSQSLTVGQRKEAIRLYQEGWSLARVGQQFGRQHTVIRDVLVRAGILRRDSHGRERQSGDWSVPDFIDTGLGCQIG